MTLSSGVLPTISPLRSSARASVRERSHTSRPLRVWEWPLRYENEGSERRSLGSLSLGTDAWWSVTLSVPHGGGAAGDEALFVRFERHGAPPAGYRGSIEAALSLPRSEIDAFVTLLAGVVDQARRDGVLPASASSTE